MDLLLMIGASEIFLGGLVVALHFIRISSVNNRPIEGDAFTYLRVAREIVSQRRWFPELAFYYTGERELLQLPPLLMWLLAPLTRLPYRVLIHLPFAIDLATSALVYAGGTWALGFDPAQALLAALLLMLAPINATTSAALTARGLGLFWLTAAVLAGWQYLQGGSPLWVVAGAVATALAILSQRMVTQVIVLLFPLIGFGFAVAGEPRFLAVAGMVPAGLLLALAVTGGQYGRALADHWHRIIVHARTGQQDRQRWEFGNPLQVLKANPWLAVLALLLVCGGPVHDWEWLPLGMVAGLVLLAVFWVMGNSVNHVLFAAPFIAWLVAGRLPPDAGWQAGVTLVALACALVVWREFGQLRRRQMAPAWPECYRFIGEHGLSGRVVVVPQVACPSLVYYTPLVLLAAGHGAKALTFDRMTIKKAMTNLDSLRALVAAHDVDFVLVDGARAPGPVMDALRRDGGEHFQEMFASGSLALFRVARLGEH